jgi:hypothetical protein
VDGTEQSGIESPEPQLVKGRPSDAPVREFLNGSPESGEAAALPPSVAAPDRMAGSIPEPVSAGPGSASNGAAELSQIGAEIAVTETPARPANRDIELPAHAALSETGNTPGALGTAGPEPQPGEPRRTLHLPLSHNNPQPMEISHNDGNVADMTDASAVRPVATDMATNNGGAIRSTAESFKKDSGAFIDRALRERVDGDISAFLAAFDAALAEDTIESRADLREATDRLLRAGARTRIELERLEARMPLSAREASRYGYSAPSWRAR